VKREPPDRHEQPYLAICRKVLSQIPSRFARLAWLSEHFDSSFGRYCDPDCEPEYGSEQVNRALRALHLMLFDKWLDLPLDDQLRDFKLFITAGVTDAHLPPAVENWSGLQELQQILPRQTIDPDRKLVDITFGVILSLIAAQR
jgi:hypothetical protein